MFEKTIAEQTQRPRRRQFLRSTTAAVTGLAASSLGAFASAPRQPADAKQTLTLGFSTYGMKTLRTEEAIGHLARIGFDSVELTVWPGWDAAPDSMLPARRREVRSRLNDHQLQLTSLMEHIVPSGDDDEHRKHLARLRGVFELASDLSERNSRPVVQTVLGGGHWEQKRKMIRDRVGDWVSLAAEYEMVLAVKPHRGGVMSQPAQAVSLIQQLGKPQALRMVYDYSHYAFRGLTIEQTVATALPWIAHVAVKDAVQKNDRVVFRLPGETGGIPYEKLLRLIYDGGYRGDVNCEVSGMVWSQPGYAPVEAAEKCYAAMAATFDGAQLPRPVR